MRTVVTHWLLGDPSRNIVQGMKIVLWKKEKTAFVHLDHNYRTLRRVAWC